MLRGYHAIYDLNVSETKQILRRTAKRVQQDDLDAAEIPEDSCYHAIYDLNVSETKQILRRTAKRVQQDDLDAAEIPEDSC
ncbi:unnamed protein product [Brugia pahangi]|uniref:Uncharacterized protein n=1 Tax=Brugia pahangi TaxID=6280 RepID=A0A0N4U078_BRUPA|nr:unnamed protein product [Brugia pahangi]